jgi:hypothetical protein
MKVKARKKLITPKQREREKARVFRPLAIELGWIVYEWNRLHAAMGELFADVVSKDNLGIGLSIWNCNSIITNERAQRAMLRAAIDGRWPGSSKPRAHQDIGWILNKVDALAFARNRAIHSPLVFLINALSGAIEISPMHFFGNPRADELTGKSLLEEYRWYRDHLSKLADFAIPLHFAINFPEHAWPDRPRLLPREQFLNRGAKHRKRKSKAHQRPPQSSGA